jgi:hypothetical protein
LILIQDPEFLDAYLNGIIIECIDGIKRRLFPRFFIYSADYPEKSIISSRHWPLSHVLQGQDRDTSRLRVVSMHQVFNSEGQYFQTRHRRGQNHPQGTTADRRYRAAGAGPPGPV